MGYDVILEHWVAGAFCQNPERKSYKSKFSEKQPNA